MRKYKKSSEHLKAVLKLLLLLSVLKLNQVAETDALSEIDYTASAEIFVLLDYETGHIYYRDEQLKACLVEGFDPVNQNEQLLIMPRHLSNILPEDDKNATSQANLFCEDFPMYALSKLKDINFVRDNAAITRNKRSANQWYPGGVGGASQSQVQGQVSGQGFFSGQAQSQLSGASQTQVQLNGNGILGSVSSSAGNAQAQISLGEYTGSGQAGSLGLGPSKSQVQINLGQDGRGSMASAGVLADEAMSYSSDGRGQQFGNTGFGIGDDRSTLGGSSGYPNGYRYSGNGAGHYLDDSNSRTAGSGGNGYRPTSYNSGARNHGGSVYNSHPGYQNGGSTRTPENNIHPGSQHVSYSANLPQLPDIRFSSPHPIAGIGQHERTNFEDLRTQDRYPTGHGGPTSTNGIAYPPQTGGGGQTNGASHSPISSYRQPTVARQHFPTTSFGQQGRNGGNGNGHSLSGNRYNDRSGIGGRQNGVTSYAGGAGLPHAIASSYGASQAQAQSQSQMVHLGRGTTEFYRPQQYGIGNSYPQSTLTQFENGRQNGDTSFRPGVRYPDTGNGRATGMQSRQTNSQLGRPQQHSTSTGGQDQTSSNLSQNATRDTIRDGYIPTDDGYVRPYLNGVPRQQAGINGNGQNLETSSTRWPVTSVPQIVVTQTPASHVIRQFVDQNTQQYPSYPLPSGQQASRTNTGNGYNPGGRVSNSNEHYPTSGQTFPSQQYTPSRDTTSQDHYPTNYERSHTAGYGSNGNGNGKKCSVVTFTCTILIESNGRAKICRPNGSQGNQGTAGGDYGQIDQPHLRSMQICCC